MTCTRTQTQTEPQLRYYIPSARRCPGITNSVVRVVSAWHRHHNWLGVFQVLPMNWQRKILTWRCLNIIGGGSQAHYKGFRIQTGLLWFCNSTGTPFLKGWFYTYCLTSSIPSQSTTCSTEKLVSLFPCIAHKPSMLPIALQGHTCISWFHLFYVQFYKKTNMYALNQFLESENI